MNRNILSIIWMLLFFAFGSEAQAATASTSATATIVAPVGIGFLNDLDFGTIVPGATQTGTVTVNPATGARTPAGGVTLVNSLYGAALFNITGSPSTSNNTSRFHINLPVRITIRNTANTNITMMVDIFTSDLQQNGNNGVYTGTFDGTGSASFHVGGTLNVGINQAPGAYSGIFTVDVHNN